MQRVPVRPQALQVPSPEAETDHIRSGEIRRGANPLGSSSHRRAPYQIAHARISSFPEEVGTYAAMHCGMRALSRSATKVRHFRRTGGFSIPEAVVALGIGTMSLGSAMLLNAHELRLVKTTRDTSAASGTIEERVEQLRIANWRQMTNATYLANTVFATQPKSVAPLDNVRESITVSAWPDASVCQPLEVAKGKNSPASIVSAGAGLTDQKLAKVDVTITWRTRDGRDRVKELTTIISNGGISRMNLPAMGQAAGSSESTTTASDTAPDVPADEGIGAGTGGESTSTGGETTTATGNGNGRGNVGGKGGKK